MNPNRNSKLIAKDEIEREFSKLGIIRTIWLEGDPDEPITSGHIDGYVLFNAPGSVVTEIFDDELIEQTVRRSRDITALEKATDAAKRTLNVKRIRAPRQRYWKFRGQMFAPCYLNAYIANGAVITVGFGDVERDEAAKSALEQSFPGRTVVMLSIDHIAAGGGGVHCLTQQMLETEGARYGKM